MKEAEEVEKEASEESKTEETEESIEEVKEETVEEIEENAEEEKEVVPEEEVEEIKEEAEEVSLRRREEIPEEVVEERIYTIPLREAWRSPRKHRVPRAIRIIRSFIQRHMKVGWKVPLEEEGEEEGRVIISNEVNEWVWRRGIEKPPRKVRVRAVKDRDGNVTVYLAEGD